MPIRLAAVVPSIVLSVLLAGCGGTPKSYDLAAMDASYSGDMDSAIGLAKKEVARFATPDQCSAEHNLNCGTLALAYGSLAQYQIAAGDRAAGEISFGHARDAMGLMDLAYLPATAGVVYRDVSEAFWKAGDRARARRGDRAGPPGRRRHLARRLLRRPGNSPGAGERASAESGRRSEADAVSRAQTVFPNCRQTRIPRSARDDSPHLGSAPPSFKNRCHPERKRGILNCR